MPCPPSPAHSQGIILQKGLALEALDCTLHVLQLVIHDVKDNRAAKELQKANLSVDDAPDVLGQLHDDIRRTSSAIMAARDRRGLLASLLPGGILKPLVREFAIRWSNLFLMTSSFADVAAAIVGCSPETFYQLVGCKSDSPGEWKERLVRLRKACEKQAGGVSVLSDIIALLRPAADWTRVMQGEYITISLVVPMYLHLRNLWSPSATSSMTKEGKYVASMLLKYLHERLGYVVKSSIYVAATMLDPATLPAISAESIGEKTAMQYVTAAIDYLHGLARKMDPEGTTEPSALVARRGDWMDEALARSLGTGVKLTVTVQATASHDAFKAQMGIFMQELRAAVDTGMTAKELYAARPPEVVDQCFIVRSLGRQILSTSASNAGAERVGSDFGDVVTPERNRIRPSKVEAHLIINKFWRNMKDRNRKKATGTTVGARVSGGGGGAAASTSDMTMGAAATDDGGGGGAATGAAGGGAGGKRKREVVTVDSLLKGYMSKLPPLSLADIAAAQERLLDEHVFEFNSATGSIEFVVAERDEYEDEDVVEEVEIGEESVEEGGGVINVA